MNIGTRGRVYLLGAGIGGKEYLTGQAQEILARAEVLIYDDLVDSSIRELVPEDCEQIDVGKRGGRPSASQQQINELLVHHCQGGKRVIRLKSGDPIVFGRVYAEMAALQAAGCDFQLIPGISSALAAPLLAGIPLTEKDLGRCFAVLSAHAPDGLDWSALTRIDTLVILMGGRSLPGIVENLWRSGRGEGEAIAIIRNAGRADQQIWKGTLGDIVAKTARASLSPSIMIVGSVVSKAIVSSPLPLSGKTVLVTRAAEQSSEFTTLLQQQGARAIEFPALSIGPPSSWQGLDRAIEGLWSFQWLILTSANAVDFFFDRLTFLEKDARDLAGVRIAVVGKKTAKFLQARGLRADFVPKDFVADALVRDFPEAIEGKRFLFPRVETGGREVLVQELTEKGGKVVEVAAYESGCPDRIAETAWSALKSGQVDLVTFASSKTVVNFATLVEKEGVSVRSLLENICIASIGPQTSKSCQELFGRVDVEAREYTLEGLTKALSEWSWPQP
jgi:uroporphyrinogen III methyltransferase / synthase